MTTEKIINHYGHDIVIAKYGDSYAIECTTCYEILIDTDALEA